MPSEESRRVELNGRELTFRLRRSSRRSIGLRIDASGLTLAVPLQARDADILAALQARAAWIFRHLHEWQQRPAPAGTILHSGASLLYLGQPHELTVHAGRATVEHLPGELHVHLPNPDDQPRIARLLQDWYRRQAIPHFSSRIHVYATRLNVAPPMLALTSARTRWGSCNHKGDIRLHWRLMQAAPALIDYVIAHELAHIIELNHSPRFWAEVERVFPAWREARARLKDEGGRLWAW